MKYKFTPKKTVAKGNNVKSPRSIPYRVGQKIGSVVDGLPPKVQTVVKGASTTVGIGAHAGGYTKTLPRSTPNMLKTGIGGKLLKGTAALMRGYNGYALGAAAIGAAADGYRQASKHMTATSVPNSTAIHTGAMRSPSISPSGNGVSSGSNLGAFSPKKTGGGGGGSTTPVGVPKHYGITMPLESVESTKQHRKELLDTGHWGKRGAGAIIIAMDTNRVLLPKRSAWVEEPNTWGVWGGAIDDGENPLNAAMREVSEETGYQGDIINAILLYVFTKNKFTYSTYLVTVAHEFEPTTNWETSDSEWFDIGEWPTPLHFGLKDIIKNRESQKILKMASKI